MKDDSSIHAADAARAMLAVACRDLKSLAHMLNPHEHDDEIFGFLAQQAVEKALKAWLIFRGCDYKRTHDLQYLIDLLSDAGVEVDELRPLAALTPFAVEMRYPACSIERSSLDRMGALSEVQALIARLSAELSLV